MLTRNGKALYSTPDETAGVLGLRLTNGWSSDSTISRANFANNSHLFVGSGNTQPTVDDANLSARIETLTKITETRSNVTSWESNYMSNVQATFKNNTEENITVNEVGFFLGSGYYEYLIAREVLDTPIVIRPQKTHSFSIIIG